MGKNMMAAIDSRQHKAKCFDHAHNVFKANVFWGYSGLAAVVFVFYSYLPPLNNRHVISSEAIELDDALVDFSFPVSGFLYYFYFC